MESPFLQHYKNVLALDEEDFNNFSDACHRPLPVTLRIEDQKIRDFLIQHHNGDFKNLEFFKQNYVLQLDANKFKTSTLKPIVISLTEAGIIYRQEVVSMLPVFFLNIDSDHVVLDMCAAPGSKTTQVLQIIKKGTGMLVSNDVNPRRCSVLSMHAKKYCCPSHIVTANDARFFPKMAFNRILCDVPCSGDGTVRKSGSKLQRWRLENSKGLGSLQFSILKRGLELLKEDGILCYSTCSLSPYENEAIVQRALETLDCELIDLPKIPGFKSRPGMVSWEVPENNFLEDWMYPQKLNIGLEKCMRILPHDNDTGGFFIALFRKKRAHAEICLKLSDDSQAGITLDFDGRLGKDFLQAGFHIRDLKTNQETGFSIGAGLEENHGIIQKSQKDSKSERETPNGFKDTQSENNHQPKNFSENHDRTEFSGKKDEKVNNRNTNTVASETLQQPQQDSNKNIAGSSGNFSKNISDTANSPHNQRDLADKSIDDATKEKLAVHSTDDEKKNHDSLNQKKRKHLRSLVCKDELYEIDDTLKTQIEKCFDIRITDKLISHSKTKNKVSIVSNDIYNILKTGPKSLRVVSAGAHAFNENNLRAEEISFRAYKGILEKYGYKGEIATLDLNETLAVIQSQSVNNEILKNHDLKKGVGVFKLHGIDGLFCGQVFENTTALYISKKMRSAIKHLIS